MHGISSQLQKHGSRGPTARCEFDYHTCAKALTDAVIARQMSAGPGNHLEMTYFAFKTEFRFEPYIWQSKNGQNRRCIALFRLGCHWLQVHHGRVHREPSHGGRIPYEQRMCPSCQHCIEDEEHAIFHCPDYQQQRSRFKDLFEDLQPSNRLRSFLVHNPSHRLALYLIACKDARAQAPSRGIINVDLTHELGIPPEDIDRYDSDDDS